MIVVSGGIRFFPSNKKAVLKWCLNRADIAKNTGELKKIASVSKQYNIYKPMRPLQILLGEKRVTDVIRILEEEFINPFGVGFIGCITSLQERKWQMTETRQF